MISPNRNELFTIGNYLGFRQPDDKSSMDLELIRELAEQLALHIPIVIVTLGSDGLLVSKINNEAIVFLTMFFYSCNLCKKNISIIIFQVARKAPSNEPFYDETNNLIETGSVQSRIYPTTFNNNEILDKIVSVSGSGDCLAAGMMCGILRGLDEERCVSLALRAAALSLKSHKTVPSTLSSLRVIFA